MAPSHGHYWSFLPIYWGVRPPPSNSAQTLLSVIPEESWHVLIQTFKLWNSCCGISPLQQFVMRIAIDHYKFQKMKIKYQLVSLSKCLPSKCLATAAIHCADAKWDRPDRDLWNRLWVDCWMLAAAANLHLVMLLQQPLIPSWCRITKTLSGCFGVVRVHHHRNTKWVFGCWGTSVVTSNCWTVDFCNAFG